MPKIRDEFDQVVRLVRCALRNEAPGLMPEGLSFETVFRCAAAHGVENIAFYSLERSEDKPEEALYQKWAQRRDMAVMREINQQFARDEIVEAFRAAGIRSLEMQGTCIRRLYPEPAWRTMSDIDFIVDPENLGRAAEILRGLGYTPNRIQVSDREFDGFREPNIFVEVHTDYFGPDYPYDRVLGAPFTRLAPGDGLTREADTETFYLFTLLHMAKHYFYKGMGIRRVLDLYILNRAYGPMWAQGPVAEKLAALGLTDFAAQAASLADYWFGDGDFSADFEEMAFLVKAAGEHGSARSWIHGRLLEKKKESGRHFKAKYLWARLFPGRKMLEGRYPVLGKCPLLLPACWVVRFFDLFRKREQLRMELREIRKIKKQGS